MNPSGKAVACFILIIALSAIFVQSAKATAMNLIVQGGQEVTRTLDLVAEDHVLIRFTVLGQSARTLRFHISYPNETSIEFGEVGEFSYSFICDAEGEYVLHFSNKDSAEEKRVALDYEVQHYIFGVPQMLFLTVIIVLVCVGAVAAFVLMGKPY
jgi:hypothetical protein